MANELINIPGFGDLLKQLGSFGPPFAPAAPTVTLESFIKSKGSTFQKVAQRAGVDPVLLTRIDAGRQPLPELLAMRIATVLGVQVGEVLGAAKLTTPSNHPRNFVPLPPRPELGDTIEPVPAGKTKEVLLPAPASLAPGVWAVGPGISGANAGVVYINRNNAVAEFNVPTPLLGEPRELVADAQGKLWTFGSTNLGGGFYAGKIDPPLKAIVLQTTDAGYNAPLFCAFDSGSGTLWVANTAGTTISAVNITTGAVTTSQTISDGVNNFNPRDMVVAEGFLWVLGRRTISEGNYEGRVFKRNATTGAAVAVSTGTDLDSVFGIAHDGAGNLYVTESETGKLHKIPTSTLVAPAVFFDVTSANPNVQQLGTVSFSHGHVWVSALDVQFVGPDPFFAMRLCKITSGAAQAATRLFTQSEAGASLGYHVSDGTNLWVSEPTPGKVHKLDPASIAADLATVTTGGQPFGLVLTA